MRTIKTRDTVILVVLVHIGLVLIWICMGGCGAGRTRTTQEIHPDRVAIPDTTEGITMETEPVGPISEPILITRETPLEPTAPVVTSLGTEEVRYVVKKADTLWAISQRFGVSVDAIVERNDIQNPAMIREGRELWIPASATDVTATIAPTTPTTPTKAATIEPTTELTEPTEPTTPPTEPTEPGAVAEDEFIIHTVVEGDTIWKLARAYGTTSTKIMELNGITDPKRVQIGQKLRIPK